jgi:hypothetical protein
VEPIKNTCYAPKKIKLGFFKAVAINDHYFIFMPFAIEKRNFFSALSCKIKLLVGLTNSGAEQTRPSNAPICSRPEQFASPFAELFASHHLNDKVVACSFEGKKKSIILFKKAGCSKL